MMPFTQKSVGFFQMKLVWCILLLKVCSFAYAIPDSKIQPQFKVSFKEVTHNYTGELPSAFIESETGIVMVSFSDFKKTKTHHFFNTDPLFEQNLKTRKLYNNFVHFVIPSLETTTLIFPFHSFY